MPAIERLRDPRPERIRLWVHYNRREDAGEMATGEWMEPRAWGLAVLRVRKLCRREMWTVVDMQTSRSVSLETTKEAAIEAAIARLNRLATRHGITVPDVLAWERAGHLHGEGRA